MDVCCTSFFLVPETKSYIEMIGARVKELFIHYSLSQTEFISITLHFLAFPFIQLDQTFRFQFGFLSNCTKPLMCEVVSSVVVVTFNLMNYA